MKHSSFNDRSLRQKFKEKEPRIKFFKFVRTNAFFPLAVRAKAAYNLASLQPHITRVHNYCVLTARSRGLVSSFKVSRMVFKRLASFGALYGVKKSSW